MLKVHIHGAGGRKATGFCVIFRRHKKIKYKHKSLDNFMIKTDKWKTDSFECC